MADERAASKTANDQILGWLGARVLVAEYACNEAGESPKLPPPEREPPQAAPFETAFSDAPLCSEWGGLMTRNGSCYKCENCGGTSGCS